MIESRIGFLKRLNACNGLAFCMDVGDERMIMFSVAEPLTYSVGDASNPPDVFVLWIAAFLMFPPSRL